MVNVQPADAVPTASPQRFVVRRLFNVLAWLNGVAAVLVLFGLWRPLDFLAHLAPVWFFASGLLCIAVFAFGARRPLFAAVLGIVAPTVLMAPELIAATRSQPATSADAPRLTVLTLNLWSASDEVANVRALIRNENPDIIVLQEAWAPWKRLTETLPGYTRHIGCHYDSDCNVVILSRLRPMEVTAESDGSVAAVRLELPERLGGGAVDVMGVHLARPATAAGERAQLARVAAVARGIGSRGIVAGDFNATPWSRQLRDLDRVIPGERLTRALFSWPTPARGFTLLRLRSPSALVPIDHVYAGPAWRVAEVRRGPNVGSDHYPVIVTLTLAPPAQAAQDGARHSPGS